ncbi:MAG: RMD1 family protein [Burkholderiales bacterium]|nr:RMD1 family protein [Burkholderiales bacterium]
MSVLASPAFRARAVLLGERIDLRGWQPEQRLADSPRAVPLEGGGIAILFRYGVVVFFDVDVQRQQVFLESLQPVVAGWRTPTESEEVEVRVEPGAREGVSGPAVVLGEATVERLQVIADILSKSVLLGAYESQMAGAFDRVEPFAVELRRTGRIGAGADELVKHTGATLLAEHLMVGRAAVGEKPELLWERPDLEPLFVRLEDEFEIRERLAMLERKLGVVSSTAQAVLQLLQNRRSLRLELYIVLLIVAEILLTLYELFVHRAA